MRVAYVARWDAAGETGVIKKIRMQLETWGRLGVDGRLFVLSPSRSVWKGLEGVPLEVVQSAGGLSRSRDLGRLLTQVRRWSPDVVYLRYSTHYFPLERLMDEVPTVLELNTDDIGEYRLYLPWHKYGYHRLTRGRILRRARGMISVTREIGRRFASFGVPVETIANGVDLERHPMLPPAGGSRVRAVFIGSDASPWHGVDKIYRVAERLPLWSFDVVGPRPCAGLPENVTVHGHLDEPGYRAVMAAADVAIGTLALHRNGMDEACPLKVREYLAAGLPCIIGHEDTDFSPPPDFVLQLPNDEDNLVAHASAVEAFGSRWRGRRVPREGVQHLDLVEKERRRLSFFRAVTQPGRGVPAAAELDSLRTGLGH